MARHKNVAALTVSAILLGMMGTTASFAEANRPVIKPIERPNFPLLSLPQREAAGQRAIDLLGPNLPAVAAWYDKSPDEFRDLLLKDKTSRIDRNGRLFHVDDLPEQGTLPTAPNGIIDGTLMPLDQTFKLHSKLGAKRTIYLDFDGADLTNTAWSSGATIIAPAYDIDGNPSAFSNTELQNIQNIWQRVAEDYAPFDVNVTTEAPPQSAITRTDVNDLVYGTVALITTRAGVYSCSCGGVAYVGIFSNTSDRYKPALVFYDALAKNNKYIAEATSHEVGHNIGLSHDGTSSTGYYTGHSTGTYGWAPIMGVGYYQPVVQFSKGEYANANQKQDDFIVAGNNGLPLRPLSEDVGDTIGSATLLVGQSTATGLEASEDSVIETAADKDVFAFTTGSGSVTIALKPVTASPNLDAKIQLLNSTGTVIAESNPQESIDTTKPFESLGAAITITLAGGTYYVVVDGVGKGDPLTTGYSDYGSLGWYRITATYPSPDADAPLASFTATPTTGFAPLTVALDASSSSAAAGQSITSYTWNFGDNTSTTGVISTSKVFQNAGTFNVILSVTDSGGRLSTSSQTIVVNPAVVLSTVHVASITMSKKIQKNGSWSATANVTVRNNNGALVPNATVSGQWSGDAVRAASAITGSTGVAVLNSPLSKIKGGSFTFTVNTITASGYTYEAGASTATSNIIYR